MKEVKLSKVEKSPIGELGFENIQMVRFSGSKDLHPKTVFDSQLELLYNFSHKKIELYFVVEDKEYILINDKESSYETAIK